jgi:pyridoxamine 5'-phosphate oxidase
MPMTPPTDRTPDRAADRVQGDPVQGDTPLEDPAVLAASWLPPEGADPMRMTLSTIDEDGFPRGRTVLLSEFDGERFFFHTDAASRKVADLAANPRVALTVLWPDFSRQLVVQGTAQVAPAEEQARAFRLRSGYLKQLAWQNTAEYAQLPLGDREAAWARFRDEVPAPAQPEGWVGYAVVPHRILFWVANPDAASRRVEYVRTESGWDRRYLPG